MRRMPRRSASGEFGSMAQGMITPSLAKQCQPRSSRLDLSGLRSRNRCERRGSDRESRSDRRPCKGRSPYRQKPTMSPDSRTSLRGFRTPPPPRHWVPGCPAAAAPIRPRRFCCRAAVCRRACRPPQRPVNSRRGRSGSRARSRHRRDAVGGVGGPVGGGQEVVAGGIVDTVCGQGAAADLPLERIGESLAGPSEAGRVVGSAGEDDLDIGARVRRR